MLRLSELIARAGIEASILGNAEVEIAAITGDSRQVVPGALFAALPGAIADGTRYIPDAIRLGAAVLLVAERSRTDLAVSATLVRVKSVRAAITALAAAFYPEQPAHCYAVTGTDGKTSTADFVRQLAKLSGRDAASIGTLGLRSQHAQINAAFPAVNTSPEPVLLHHTLQQLARAGVSDVAIETSSHGLDQKRADGVKFIAGAFTNLARDHLDYHATLEDYFAAKARLFSQVLSPGAIAVLNRDDARYDALKAMAGARDLTIISFGTHADADYRIAAIQPTADGLDAQVVVAGVTHQLTLPFYGAFQLSNMLTAIGLLSASGLEASALIALLPSLKGVPGRLEKIAISKQGAPIFIDYAHTPAALENILKTLRPHTAGKLHVVFGCGGDRDAGKRPEMGRAASQYADDVIVTDDNPRSENPAAIRAAILAAAQGATEIEGRASAIAVATKKLQAGDVLVVAGKGHETTQTIGTQIHPFNDADEIRKAVAA
ncbi:MAG: UDP-N-acetylmuramoyl-L-alanyl-D-glutamate--2,6-diaminopimelate ligase [Rickettsiales bacterium]